MNMMNTPGLELPFVRGARIPLLAMRPSHVMYEVDPRHFLSTDTARLRVGVLSFHVVL